MSATPCASSHKTATFTSPCAAASSARRKTLGRLSGYATSKSTPSNFSSLTRSRSSVASRTVAHLKERTPAISNSRQTGRSLVVLRCGRQRVGKPPAADIIAFTLARTRSMSTMSDGVGRVSMSVAREISCQYGDASARIGDAAPENGRLSGAARTSAGRRSVARRSIGCGGARRAAAASAPRSLEVPGGYTHARGTQPRSPRSPRVSNFTL